MSARDQRSIAVYGASGHTAGFVAAELRRRGWTPILCGRDADAVRAAAARHPGSVARVATVDDPDALDRALAGTPAVINCAGPFADTAPAVVEAALRAGIHYLDVTAESLVALDMFARYDELARAAGVVVAPSVGFFGALGDLLATVAVGRWPSSDEIAIAVALDRWHPTRGTRQTGERRAGRRIVWADGRTVVRAPTEPAPAARWTFPEPVGAQDVVGELSTADAVTIPRHLPTRDIHAYLSRNALADLSDPSTPAPVAADASGRSAQRFLVEVVARRGDQERRVVARGRDIYAVTAPIVVETAERLVAGRFRAPGARAVGELFDAGDLLHALAEHVAVER